MGKGKPCDPWRDHIHNIKGLCNRIAALEQEAAAARERASRAERWSASRDAAHRSVESAWFDFDAAALERRRQQGGD